MPQPASEAPIACRLYLFNREAFDRIRPILPPPLEDSPQGHADRDQAVIAAIIRLAPANAIEAELAAMVVAHEQLQMHFVQEARRNEPGARQHERLMAHAARLERDTRRCLALLKRAQKMRIRRMNPSAAAAPDRPEPDGTRVQSSRPSVAGGAHG